MVRTQIAIPYLPIRSIAQSGDDDGDDDGDGGRSVFRTVERCRLLCRLDMSWLTKAISLERSAEAGEVDEALIVSGCN